MANSSSIVCEHTETGRLELNSRHAMADLLAVGAVTQTACYAEAGYWFPTDKEGLQVIRESLETSRTCIAAGIASVGELLSLAGVDLRPQTARDAGSLLSGLGEMILRINDALQRLDEAVEPSRAPLNGSK